MSKKTETPDAGRRNFLKLASASAPAAVAAAALGGTEAEAAVSDPANPTLKDTDHTRAYYASAKF